MLRDDGADERQDLLAGQRSAGEVARGPVDAEDPRRHAGLEPERAAIVASERPQDVVDAEAVGRSHSALSVSCTMCEELMISVPIGGLEIPEGLAGIGVVTEPLVAGRPIDRRPYR